MDSFEPKMVETFENSKLLIWRSKKMIFLSRIMREETICAVDAVWRTRREVKNTITYSKKQRVLMDFRPMPNKIS